MDIQIVIGEAIKMKGKIVIGEAIKMKGKALQDMFSILDQQHSLGCPKSRVL